ncbi:MAG: CHASE2 domain-containing protein, partial [Gammaproteobacteria bacterium]|nr:CHASE2 domain-containing protein [Gammaproteobacteria bacterium]
MSSLEWQMYGLGTRLSPSVKPGNNLQIIAIDKASLQQLGEWPWPRSYLATTIKHLNSNGAKTVGLALPLHTAQSEFGVRRLDSMRDTYKGKYKKTVKDILFLARQRLDTDGALATSLKRSDNTVLAITYGLNNDTQAGPASTSNRALKFFALPNFEPAETGWSDNIPSALTSGIPVLTQAQTPILKMAKNSAAGMLDESIGDNAGNLISPLVLKFSDHYYPSFSLMFAAHSLKIKPGNITFTPGQNIILGDTVLNTDPAYRIYPRIYESPDGQPAFKVHSFSDIYANKNYAQFKNKDVLIGITATSLVDQATMPDGNTMAPLIINAHLISNLLHGDMFTVPEWALPVQLMTLLIVALYLSFILPKLHLWIGFITSLLLLFIMVNIQLGMMVIGLLWLPLMLPTVTLLTGVLVIAVKRKIEEGHHRTAERLSESNLTLG